VNEEIEKKEEYEVNRKKNRKTILFMINARISQKIVLNWLLPVKSDQKISP